MKSIYLNNKLLGWAFPEKGIFRKPVNTRKHLFKLNDGWGINKDLLVRLAEKNYTVEIIDEKNRLWISPAKKMLEDGETFCFQGFEPQIIVPRKCFEFLAKKK